MTEPNDRQQILTQTRNLKMAQSAHAYVRGSTVKFYEWLESSSRSKLPEGQPVWICGHCHVGNSDLAKNHKASLEAPSWLWASVVFAAGTWWPASTTHRVKASSTRSKTYGALPTVAAQAIRRTAGHSPAQA